MATRPTWFWTSLFSSIGVNAVMLTSSACWIYSQTKVYLPGYPRSMGLASIFVERPEIPQRDTLLGDANGKGDATDSQAGETPMESMLGASAQALLSRDPEGPGRLGDELSMSTQIPGENGDGGESAPATFGAATPPAPEQAPSFESAVARDFGELSRVASRPRPELPDKEHGENARANKDEVASIAEMSVAPSPAPSPPPSPPSPPAKRQSSSSGGKPGPAVAPADPAPQSDSESDPFSKTASVKFKRGSTDVQLGRKHRIIRPRLGLAAQTAMISMHPPITLVLALTLDETGKVVSVMVLKSSGSTDIDQACKVAAYQWWLEPTKDKSGKPVKDVVPFAIGFS